LALIGGLVDAQSFSWEKGVGVAEISSFKGREGVFFGRLYDDACDVGFRVINTRTNRVEAFYLDHEDKDGSGEDTYGFHFHPANRVLADAGVRILLIND
jgi:hypothetical protein